jgi:DNA-binding transcriptional ArsR family regulator
MEIDVIAKARKDLENRLLELGPVLEEAARIRQLLRVMEDAETEGVSGSVDRPRISGEARRLQILTLLRDGDGPLRVGALADRLAVTPGRVSQLVGKLEKAGLVTRNSKGVEITSAGLEQVPPEVQITVGTWQEVDLGE